MREVKFKVGFKIKDKSISWQVLTIDEIRLGLVAFDRMKTPDYYLQYTGINDGTGKEIYEGDIVKFQANYCTREKLVGERWKKGVVEFSHDGYVLRAGEHTYSILNETDEFRYKSEVVGNIFENKY